MSLAPYHGRCPTCGHDHSADVDLLKIYEAMQNTRKAEEMTTTNEQILALAGDPVGEIRKFEREGYGMNVEYHLGADITADLPEGTKLYTADQALAARKDLEEEVERLKALVPKPPKLDVECKSADDWRHKAMYYESQWSGCSYAFNKVAGELRQQLAAAQGREQRLLKRMASTNILLEVVCVTHPDSACAKYELEENLKAINLPTDTSALEDYITRGGEVMRERCLSEIDPKHYTQDFARGVVEGCMEEIRALPGVKLDDLKGGM